MAHETGHNPGPQGAPGASPQPASEHDRGHGDPSGEQRESTHGVQDVERADWQADSLSGRNSESDSGAGFASHADLQAPHDIAPGPLLPLDPRWIITERISGAIGATVLTVGGLIAVLVFASGWRAAGLALWALLAGGLFAAAIIAPALQYPRASYRVSAFGIELRRGIFWRRVTIVPRSRIQHTDVEQGPLLRKFQLAKLVIHTAGTEHSTVPLFGLAMADAVAIRDDLIGLHAKGAPGEGASDGDGV